MDRIKKDLPSYIFALAIILVVIATNPFTSNDKGFKINSEKLNLTADYNKKQSELKLVSDKDYIQSAKAFINSNKFDQAIVLLLKANKIFPDDESIMTELSSVYLARAFQNYQDNLNKIKASDDYTQAIDLLKKNIQNYPDSPVAYNNLIDTYLNVKDYKQALSYANQVCSNNPDFKSTCSKVADIYLLTGKKSEAISFYQELLTKYQDNVWIYKKLGAIYNAQNKYNEAEKCFKNAYSKNPTSENLELLIQNYKEMSFIHDNKG